MALPSLRFRSASTRARSHCRLADHALRLSLGVAALTGCGGSIMTAAPSGVDAESFPNATGATGEAGRATKPIVDASVGAKQPGLIPDAYTSPEGTLEASGGPPLGSTCGAGGECVEGVPPMLMSHCNYPDTIIAGSCGTGLVCCRAHTDPSFGGGDSGV